MYAQAERDASRSDTVAALRAKMEGIVGRRLDAPVLPAPPVLGDLVPGGGLRQGSAYAFGGGTAETSLLLSLLARPSQEGVWCAAVGMPEIGVEAAEALGVDLARFVLVPDPGGRWLGVVMALVEVFGIVAVRPPARVTEGESARIAARLRDREAALLVQGEWPGAEALWEASDPEWVGVGEGHGILAARSVTVSVRGRRSSGARRARILLPDDLGHLGTPAVEAGTAAGLTAPRPWAMREAG